MSITIIGGGVVGSVFAIAISNMTKGQLTVNLVEEKKIDINLKHPSFDTKFIALSYSTCLLLKDIGIWSKIISYSIAITNIEISSFNYSRTIKIVANDYELPAFGYTIALKDFGLILYELLNTLPNIKIFCPNSLQELERKPSENIIILKNNYKLNSQLIVASDGFCSSISSVCGIRWKQYNYQQVAISSNITTSILHNGNAFEYFTIYGPLAMLPASNNFNSLIWCIPTRYKKEITQLDKIKFCQLLQHVFGWKLGYIIDITNPQYYPLYLKIAEKNISHRLVLIGNAAQTIHPVAGQGCNLGIRDAIILAKILTKAVQLKIDIGEYSLLRKYQQKRKKDQTNIINITDGLVQLFSNRRLSYTIIRNLGLFSIEYISLLRNFFVKKFLGIIE